MKSTHKSIKNHLRTRIIRKIEEASSDEFNKIFPNVPENYYFLKTLDESKFYQFSFYYILIYKNNQLVCACPCFLINYPLDTSINGPLRQLTNAIKKTFPHIFSIKGLVAGIPMGQGNIGIAKGISGLAEALEESMEKLAQKLHAPIIAFKDFDHSYDEFFDPLMKNAFLKIDGLPMTRLKLEFSNFDDYLKTLSESSRYDFRRKLKKAATVNIDTSLVSHLNQETLDKVYDLYLQAVETHNIGFEILPKDFFHLISINMPQETKFFLFRINGKLVAFIFCLVSNGVLLDYCLGFDYTPAHEYHLYFVKFKEIFNWCLTQGIKTYEMGATGYEPKRRLNFEFIPVYIYVKARNKLFRPFLKCLCVILKFKNFDPELRRWKKSLK